VTDYIVNPRRAPRALARCRVQVKSASSEWNAETEDVGPHGSQLVAPTPLPRGTILQLTIGAPAIREPLRVTARVAWAASQAPWRVGLAFEQPWLPAASRWFESLLASNPRLGNFRRVPDRLPVDAMVFLSAPPRFADFSPDELEVIRNIGGGITVAGLRKRLQATWSVSQRLLFALLTRSVVTLSRGAAVQVEAWRQVMADFDSSFVVDAPPMREAPTPTYVAPPEPLASAATLSAVEAAAAEAFDPSPVEFEEAPPPPAAPPAQVASAPSATPPPVRQFDAPLDVEGQASAGTGWRGIVRKRSAEAQEVFDLGRNELAEGRTKTAMALLRRALQLSPGDPEVAAELGKAMKV
jgi:hypothetical protein